jgi:glucosamine 6-phosphate synthetase-like amidotransferase/phosphosugar isomerase protein
MKYKNLNMYKYICETTDTLTHVINNRQNITRKFVDYYKDKTINQVYLVGSGSSYHAAVAAKLFLEEALGIKVYTMYPTHLSRNEHIFDKNTLVVGISQGGQSLSTVEGLDSAKDRGLYTAALSENTTALIFEHANTSTLLDIGNEKAGPKTKGYSATIITLMLMFSELSKAKGKLSVDQEREYIIRMEKVINNINPIIEASTAWYERIRNEIVSAKRIIVVGYDGLYADVLEGALKVLETMRESVVGYDIEEFFHGIYNSITENVHIIYLAPKGDYKLRTVKLIEILSEWTSHNYLIASKENIDVVDNKYLLCDFVDDPLFSSWEYIIPLQVLACFGADDKGINPDIPKDPQFHKRIGSKKLDGVRDNYSSK